VSAGRGRELDGRHVLVTGGGRGIGAGVAEEAAARGALVTVVARNRGELDRVAARIAQAGGRARTRVADVTDDAVIEAAIAEADAAEPLWGAVLSAGMNRPAPASGYPMDDFDAIFAVNVRAVFVACRALHPVLTAHGGGRIVAMSSQLGSVGFPDRVPYAASKHAVNGLVRGLAVEWATSGITVNAVAPTFVETAFTRANLASPEFRAEVLSRIPAGRMATVEEVAEATCFLLAPGSASITGHVLAVDGGWTAW
jgi:NAD(P)-dependent dehydrogenase (short-subunit alcohol dehydrogenase family)